MLSSGGGALILAPCLCATVPRLFLSQSPFSSTSFSEAVNIREFRIQRQWQLLFFSYSIKAAWRTICCGGASRALPLQVYNDFVTVSLFTMGNFLSPLRDFHFPLFFLCH